MNERSTPWVPAASGTAPEPPPEPAPMQAESTGKRASKRLGRELWSWAPVLILIGVCVALAAGGDAARQWGRYDRAALSAGQFWRLVTGHLVHLGVSHLVLDLSALVLIRVVIGTALSAAGWLGATLVSMAAIDAGLYFGAPGIEWYVGISGLLHGLLAAGAIAMLDESRRFAIVILAGIAAKILWEQSVGPVPFSELATGGTVVVAAHLYGALGGVVFGTIARFVRGRG